MASWVKGLRAGVFAVGLLGAAEAGAQALPNNVQALSGLFRVGVQIGTFSNAYDVNDADDATDFLSEADLFRRYPGTYTGTQAVQGTLDFRGVPLFGSYAAGGTTFTLRVPAFDEPGQIYLLTFTGATRVAAYQAFKDYFDETDSAEAERLIRLLLRRLTQTPLDPLAGNPGSLQGRLVRSALDLSAGDSLVDGGGADNADPWMVGAAYTRSSGGRFDSDRLDGRLQRSFRVLAGSRAQLKLEAPFSYEEVNGARSGSFAPSLALEIPLRDNRWSIEPRLAYGITASDELGSLGHIVTASVSSRYRIDGIGRGKLIIGNMVGYSSTLPTDVTGYDVDPGVKNVVFRNGLAYELPLEAQVLGRGASVRASYTFTAFTGDKLYADTFHEGTLSFGVRAREGEARNGYDLYRVNINGVKAKGYSSISAGLGFRF